MEKWPIGHACKTITREMTKYLDHANTNYRALENGQRSALHWILQGGTHPKQGIVHTRKRVRLDLIPARIMNRRGRGMRMDFGVRHINYLQAAGARSRTSAKKVILTCTDMPFGITVLQLACLRRFRNARKSCPKVEIQLFWIHIYMGYTALTLNFSSFPVLRETGHASAPACRDTELLYISSYLYTMQTPLKSLGFRHSS